MTVPLRHKHSEQHRGIVPEDQLGATAPTAGDVLTASGTGEPDWATPTTGAPSTADYLVGTAQAGLSAEIVVGATPGGELGGTWASPTVDATHSGSSHAGVISAHEASSFHPLNNLAASTAPAVTDDSGDGYSIGSIWIDTTADEAYIATDVSVGAAVWKRTTALPSGATITTQDEGGTLSTGVTTLDFVGAGVSASGAGATTTITIPGGGSVATDAIFDAAGDLVQGTGADTAAKLSAGTAGYPLVANGAAAAVGWAIAGKAHGFKAHHSATQSITSTFLNQYLLMNSEVYDTDAFHFTSNANLTGTVAKTSGSPNIVGTGTSFTTELTVNQVIEIPGTAKEYGVVKVITDNTNLELWANMANTASGQTAARRSGFFAVPAGLGGLYMIAYSVSVPVDTASNPNAQAWLVKGNLGTAVVIGSLHNWVMSGTPDLPGNTLSRVTFEFLVPGDLVAVNAYSTNTLSWGSASPVDNASFAAVLLGTA